MDFAPNPAHDALVREVSVLASQFPLTYWREKDRTEAYPSEFVDAFARAGWFGTIIPAEFGGRGLQNALLVRSVGRVALEAVALGRLVRVGRARRGLADIGVAGDAQVTLLGDEKPLVVGGVRLVARGAVLARGLVDVRSLEDVLVALGALLRHGVLLEHRLDR